MGSCERAIVQGEELVWAGVDMVNIYCADDGIWSEWSEEECWEGMHYMDENEVTGAIG